MFAWRSRRAKVQPVPRARDEDASASSRSTRTVTSAALAERRLGRLDPAHATMPSLRSRLGLRSPPPEPDGRTVAEALDALAAALALDPRARARLDAMQDALSVVEGPRFDDDADALALAVLRMDTLLCDEPALALEPDFDDELTHAAEDVHDGEDEASGRAGARFAVATPTGVTAGATPSLATSLRERAGSWRDSASHAALRHVLRAHGETFVERALRGAVRGLDDTQHRVGLELAAASHVGLFEVFPNPPGRGRTRAWVRDVVSGIALPLLDPLGGVEVLVELTTTNAPLALWELRLALTRKGAWMVRPPLDYPEQAAEIARSLQTWRRLGEPRLDLLRLRRARAAWNRAGRRASFAAFFVT